MRWHYEKPSKVSKVVTNGYSYHCDHPVYSRCTLFDKDGIGLGVIQQHYDPYSKHTYWTEIDEWLNDLIAENPNFDRYFNERAGPPVDRIYPTVTIRQLMWALRMKPLKKERWETVFDRKDI